MSEFAKNLIALRKQAMKTQKEVGDFLGVSFQTISKWENNVTLPDITLLPSLAKYFDVTIDQLLGAAPITSSVYSKRKKNTSEYRDNILSQFIASRSLYWNDDYLCFLINNVWKITQPIKVAEIACGNGFFGHQLLAHLPLGSEYVGFEKSELLRSNRLDDPKGMSLCSFEMMTNYQNSFDLVICQGYLRHNENPLKALEDMYNLACENALIVAHEENRPFEHSGLLLGNQEDTSFEKGIYLEKLWHSEQIKEQRDYRIGLRLPLMFHALDLKEIACRMNDRVNVILGRDDDKELLDTINQHYDLTSIKESDFPLFLMERGLSKHEAKRYIELYHQRKDFMHQPLDEIKLVHLIGTLITWGYKK